MTINIQTDEKETIAEPVEKAPKKPAPAPKPTAAPELLTRAEVDKLIDKALANREKELRKKIKKEGKGSDKPLIDTYKDKTRITDEKFIKQLISWQISVPLAETLQNKDSELSREKLWEYLRKEHKPKKS